VGAVSALFCDMRILLPLLAFLLLQQYTLAQRPVDVIHYRFNIELSDNSDTIRGKASVQLQFNEETDRLMLDLAGLNKQGKGMIVESCEDSAAKLESTHEGDKLEVLLAKRARKGDTKKITIVYKGIPADGLIISKTKYGQRSFFADNWPNRGHHWLACIDEPGDKAGVDFVVTAPGHYQVVSNGVLVEETNLDGNQKRTHWKEEVPISTKVMVIGVAEFAVQLAGMVNDCIPMYSWVYPQDRDKGFYDFAQAMDILPFFIKNVGPYGYKKLANVQSKTTFGGLENANTIFYAESAVNGARKKEDLLIHEIAHQWFGNMITEKSFAHLWLSEGFATYFTILYFEQKYGKEKAAEMLKEDRQQVIAFAKQSGKSIVDEDKNYMNLLNPNSYQKGGWVLHMLRKELGDSMFFKSVQSFYATYAGKNADTRDLQHICEKISGKKLNGFFDQWLYMPGLPKLDIQWRYASTEKKLVVVVKQQQEKPFAFPLEFGFKTEKAGTILKRIQISKTEERFTINLADKPQAVVIDPQTNLLFSGNVSEKK
jgi:aminopeptidase N